MKHSSILITGVNGLIGQELASQLIKNGIEFFRGIDIVDLPASPPNIIFFKGDINHPPESLFEGIDTVIHLASVMGVEYTEQNPLQTLETITNGTRRMLELSSKYGVSRFIMTSSSEVYGDIPDQPLSEDGPVSPKSVYGSAKLTAEYLCRAFHQETGLNYTIVRIFNAFGKKQSNKFVIPLFIEKAIKGEPVEIFGDGNQTRSFCHVSDVAAYILKIMELNSTQNNTYNIGDPRNNITIYELASKILGLVGNPACTVKTGASISIRDPKREIQHRRPDISAISSICGYQPVENFTERLSEMIEYKREIMEHEYQR
jgi:nucleoside-diphosphate-sugar epimerase